ncbi:hypothetical protein NX059_006749 [Plenodomus lindquistii]|nr:hypothetical protein NX059_006749 [Plenodomus lindquistii]
MRTPCKRRLVADDLRRSEQWSWRVEWEASSSTNWQARRINEKTKACQIAVNTLPSSATEVRNWLAEDHRHACRSNRNKASLRGIEAATHQPGWGFCGFFEKLRKETITIE